MEWNRGPSQTQPANQHVNHAAAPASTTRKTKRSFLSLRLASVVLLFCITILILALAGFIAFGGPPAESKFVSKDRMQAIFLNGGQVYFGNITDLNDKFMRVSKIYYLRVNQTVQPNGNAAANNQDVSLVKLGCELHGPDDSMVINQEQVIFWENLKTDGQVAKAVADYKQKNPNGQKCDQAADANTNTNTTNTTPSTTTPTTTTPTTTTPTTKKP
ncbi:MAG TPA: hypothetical protein VM124_00375 [Candidatus Limnocylindrales bacterium]|nr:hypothetical protein [Candidatus Limnocylindrales bacterium]